VKKELDVVAALIKKDSKILLCQRKRNDFYANLWEFPGGTVEEGELYEQAIEREIAEELGIEITAEKLVGKFYDENESLKIEVFLFSCRIKKGEPFRRDCQDFGFYSFREAKDLNLAPVDRKIYEYLNLAEKS